MIIAQVTDTHLRSKNRTLSAGHDPLPGFRKALAKIEALSPKPDALLLTGDLVHDPIDETYNLLLDHIKNLTMPVFAVPGNHDERAAMYRAFAPFGYLNFDDNFLHYVVDDFPLTLIGLDTTFPDEIGGGLCAKRLRWLEQALDRTNDKPVMIFMHHPPFASGIAFMERWPFKGAKEFTALISRYDHIIQIVCGHLHRPLHRSLAGTTVTVAPSTVFQIGLDLTPDAPSCFVNEPLGFNLYHWQGGHDLVCHWQPIDDFGPAISFEEARKKHATEKKP